MRKKTFTQFTLVLFSFLLWFGLGANVAVAAPPADPNIRTNINFPTDWPGEEGSQTIVTSFRLYNPITGEEYTSSNTNNLLHEGDEVLVELNFNLYYKHDTIDLDIADDVKSKDFELKLPSWLYADMLPDEADMQAKYMDGGTEKYLNIGKQSIVKEGTTYYYKLAFNDAVSSLLHVGGKVYTKLIYNGDPPTFHYDLIGGSSTTVTYNPQAKSLQKTGVLVPGTGGKQSINWTIYGNIKSNIENLFIRDTRLSNNFRLDNANPVVSLAGVTLTNGTDYTINDQDTTGFQINFTDTAGTKYIGKQIKIEFTTPLESNVADTYTNKAQLGGSNIDREEAQAPVIVQGPAISKKMTSIDYANKIIYWEIIYNGSRTNIPVEKAYVIDYITGDHTFKTGSLEIFVGNEVIAQGDTTYKAEYKERLGGANADTLTIRFLSHPGEYFINNEYTIKYQTEFTDTNNGLENRDIRNIIGEWGIESWGSAEMLKKTFDVTDYRTDVDSISWTIEINKARKNLETLGVTKVEDVFWRKGQTAQASDIIVIDALNNNEVLKQDIDYTLTFEDNVTYEGFASRKFIVETKPGGKFLKGEGYYVIKVKSKFALDDLTYDPSVADNDKIFQNVAIISSTNPTDTLTSIATFKPINLIANHGVKIASYDYHKREITWQLALNTNNRKFPFPIVIDTLHSGQKYVANSLRLGLLYVTEQGQIDSLLSLSEGSRLEAENLTINPVNPNKQVLSFKIEGTDADFNKSIYVTFKTSLENQLIDQKAFENNACFTSSTQVTDTITVKGSIDVRYGETHLVKSSSEKDEQGNVSTDHIYWNLLINPNRSTLSGVYVTDTITCTPEAMANAIILDKTKVYLFGTNQDVQGGITPNYNDTIDPQKYTLTFKDNSLKLQFKNDISEAYVLRYETYVNTDKPDGAKITNDARIYALNLTDSSTVHGTPGDLLGDITGILKRYAVDVIKVHAKTTNHLLNGAVFDVYRVTEESGKKDTAKVLGGITTGTMGFPIGHYHINLTKGDYLLYETKAPLGYLLPAEKDRWTPFKVIEAAQSDTVRVIVENAPATYPESYLKVTLPPVEFKCVSTDPVAGTYYVKEGDCFSFYFQFEYCCELPYPFVPIVTVNGDTIQAKPDGSYEICDIREGKDIVVTYKPKDPVGNESLNTTDQIRVVENKVFITVEKRTLVRIYNILGQLIRQQTLSDGQTIIPLEKGVYVVSLDDGTTKNVIIK